MVRDGEVRAEQLESVVVELLYVVRDDNLGNSKSVDNVLPHKISSVLLNDFGERLYLYSICKVVYGDDQKLPL